MERNTEDCCVWFCSTSTTVLLGVVSWRLFFLPPLVTSSLFWNVPIYCLLVLPRFSDLGVSFTQDLYSDKLEWVHTLVLRVEGHCFSKFFSDDFGQFYCIANCSCDDFTFLYLVDNFILRLNLFPRFFLQFLLFWKMNYRSVFLLERKIIYSTCVAYSLFSIIRSLACNPTHMVDILSWHHI